MLGKSFERFLVDDAKPDVSLRIRCVDPRSLTLPPLSEREIGLLSLCTLYPSDGLNSPLLRSPMVRACVEGRLDHAEAVSLELRVSSVTIFDFCQRELVAFYTPEFGRVLANCQVFPIMFAPFLPTFSAAMVHSSGLLFRGAVALFLASDEGGKTTVVEHSTEGTILCDDHIILRNEGDIVMAHGTPWGLHTTPFDRARVGGFFLLEQADRFELIPLKPANVLEYLWDKHLAYRFVLPKHLRIRLFELLHYACHQAPAYKMLFTKDSVDWKAVDSAMVR